MDMGTEGGDGSFPWDTVVGHTGMVPSCTREVQTGHHEAFLCYQIGQTLGRLL